MSQFLAILKKEFLVLVRDKVGWLMMFFMPIFLVLIITAIQDSAFNNISSKKIDVYIQNTDTSDLGNHLINSLGKNEQFQVHEFDASTSVESIKESINKGDADVGIVIPQDFSHCVLAKATNISEKMTYSIQGADPDTIITDTDTMDIQLFFDPAIQSSFKTAIKTGIQTIIFKLEANKMVDHFYENAGNDGAPEGVLLALNQNIISLNEQSTQTNSEMIPNSTQHNIPAWTVFAMFFIALSFSSNIVYERKSACYSRIQMMPVSFSSSLIGKLIMYVALCFFQAIVLFLIGRYLFPLLGLPMLEFPANIGLLLLVITVISLAATSYGLLIGTYANSLHQSNGVSAISVMIFAAIGGIWVPSFVMPESFEVISEFSPLKWGVSLFSGVFLRGEGIAYLKYDFLKLFSFIAICFIFVYIKFRKENT